MNDLVTLEVVRRYIGAEGHQRPALPGDPAVTVSVSRKRAQELIDARVCRVPPTPKPAEPEVAAPKKSFGTATAIPSTGTPWSSALGRAIASSALAVAHRLRGIRPSARDLR